MNLETLDRNDLLKELFELARERGVANRETWNELVGEVMDSHLDWGEQDPDQDIEGVKDLLEQAWEEYKREAGPESPLAIDEDPESPRP